MHLHSRLQQFTFAEGMGYKFMKENAKNPNVEMIHGFDSLMEVQIQISMKIPKNQVLALGFGFSCIGLAFLADWLGTGVLQV